MPTPDADAQGNQGRLDGDARPRQEVQHGLGPRTGPRRERLAWNLSPVHSLVAIRLPHRQGCERGMVK